MKNYKKYYASACPINDGNFLHDIGFRPTMVLGEADVVVFGGGADVEPSTYGESSSSRTWPNKERESQEKKDFNLALKAGKKFFGICRGQQLLCALAGGKLIQDVTGHVGDHSVTTFDDLNLRTNSLHHQMINPYNLDPKNYRILAWSQRKISTRYIGARDKPVYLPWDFREIEAVSFPRINAFAVQYHPEMMYGSKRKEHDGIMTWTEQTFLKFFNNQM